jgi:hypothetical protein
VGCRSREVRDGQVRWELSCGLTFWSFFVKKKGRRKKRTNHSDPFSVSLAMKILFQIKILRQRWIPHRLFNPGVETPG